MFFTYPENPAVKMLNAYVLYDKKDPLQANVHATMHNNPKLIEIKGTLYDAKTGKLNFEKPWVYITLLSQVDVRTRLVAKFKQVRKERAKPTSTSPPAEEIDTGAKDNMQQSFNFGGASVYDKKNKI